MKRFKRLTLSFVVVLGSQMIYSSKLGEDVQNSFFANADAMFIPEFDELRQLEAKPKELVGIQANNAAITIKQWGKQKDKKLKACTGKIKNNADKEPIDKCFDGTFYESHTQIKNTNGYIDEYYSGEHCSIPLVQVPGTSLLSNGLQGCGYFFFLIYLFLGISINADIFMESIEVITGTTKEVQYETDEGEKLTVDVPIWNATIANLTLLALGSSAPEILLSVIESLKDLGKPAGVLGPASIVGSGAFNLFVITGISIVSVGNEENGHEFKKIYDLGVYATTACFSIFAYSWMYFCLEIYTPDEVDLNEAWLTLFFFILLVGLSFAADKYKQNVDKRSMNETTKKEKAEKEKNTAKQCALRKKSKKYGDKAIIECARGTLESKDIGSSDQGEIKALFKALLKTEDLTKFTPEELLKVLEPEALLEKFAFKKANKIGKNADTFEMKGMKGQIEEDAPGSNSKNNHDMVGFKCLHYSVLESSGNVELTVKQKEKGSHFKFGIRTTTQGGSAKPGVDFKTIDLVHQFDQNEEDHKFKIEIIDNDLWEPDTDFFVELYDLNTNERLIGDDTQTRVTILDEDSPGQVGFDITSIEVSKDKESVDVVIKRSKGSDGQIRCKLNTEQLNKGDKSHADMNAKSNVDFSPLLDRAVVFESGEVSKTVTVSILNPINAENIDGGNSQDHTEKSELVQPKVGEEEEDEVLEKMFKIILSKDDSENFKVSSKNVCIVTITQDNDGDQKLIREKALLQYFFDNQEPSWGDQFKNAVLLGPTVDEDDLIVASPSGQDCVMHFLLIGWKLFFSIIPPVKTGGGFPAFFIALGLVGAITAIVGDVAELLGCVLSIPPAITAITLVALGTSVPDTFASVTAAQGSEYADSAVGNVTGSNSVNIFLGLGLPWVICAQYGKSINKPYEVPAGKLGFTVFIFLICSVITFIILTARRVIIGGELGGPMTSKWVTGGMCFILWFVYVALSIMDSLGVI